MTPERFRGSLISHFSRRVTRSGGINLAQGKPGFAPPRELIRYLNEAALDPALHQYAPGNGQAGLLALLVEWLQSRGVAVQEDNLLVVQGATEGLFLALFHLFHSVGDHSGVLAFDPAYESYPQLPRILGMPFHAFATNPDGDVDFKQLEAAVKKNRIRVILLASPGNPQGRVWSHEELAVLLEILDRVSGWLVFDAVYAGIHYGSPPPDPLTMGYPRLIGVDSFSKRLSITGWRVGYMVAPETTMATLRAIHDYTGLSAPSLAQAALTRYLSENDFGHEYTRGCRQICAINHELMSAELTAAGFRVAPARGGYFVWARIPQGAGDGFTLAESLLQIGVGVVPGENFSPRYRDYIRINIAMDTETIRSGAAAIRAHLANR
ncbi:MAG: pyridoxal phosphate-dependent aminotransferase, partial [Candidatus Aminicenantes bacterium]|nr:pyridoxal phosphate-dependent aminotransferase [Candidatus Aminicenantes bacterium]